MLKEMRIFQLIIGALSMLICILVLIRTDAVQRDASRLPRPLLKLLFEGFGVPPPMSKAYRMRVIVVALMGLIIGGMMFFTRLIELTAHR
ncbi:MAG: hypothetical protein JO193_09785 [Candidatus Eremiobacteraeota bacterium]|nr:hypothetical protein [Candidatus Eremiobacteraeota bacterium]MBV9972272.1 hypothetical protein [Candidatus Eremiobacteraeota bacterium]